MKRTITLLELIFSLVIVGILLVGIGFSAKIFSDIAQKSGLASLDTTVDTLENVFQRNLRGIAKTLDVSSDHHTAILTAAYPGEGTRVMKFVFVPEEKTLYYYRDINNLNSKVKVASGLTEVKFSKEVYRDGAPRLEIYLETESGNKAETSVIGRQIDPARAIVD